MGVENLLVRLNETMHRSIEGFKREAIGSGPHAEVTIAQLAYVEAVFRLKRPTLTGLAEELGVTKASASAGVHKLIHKGFLQAERAKDDRRVYYISLTQKGRKIIEAETAALGSLAAGIRAALTQKEIEALEGMLEKIAKAAG